ncbi:GNAT family N-acetyltransferase [Streptomyces sp. NPDC004647]|uniref:GNAT family N-acetyltransferase n=1 Tax=Streptomyces sp. NPDC004647 TaxID=3154671 RepID=UPI0033A10FDD
MSHSNSAIAPTHTAASAGLLIEHYDGAAVAAETKRWARIYEDVYAEALGLSDHSDPPISDRLLRHAGRPGFALVAALGGDDVAGFVYGYTLPPDSLWWDGLTPDPGAESTREYPERTVAVCELLVRAQWRRSRIGHALFEAFLAERREERATALVAADNDVMLATCTKYGFSSIGRMEPYPGWRPHMMIMRHLSHS